VLIGTEKRASSSASSRAHRFSGAVWRRSTIMLTGPMPAARKALAKAKMKLSQIDLFEVNEAFAVVPMKFMKELGVPAEKVNVNGGSIAMGHPLGATGAMLIGTLIDELERRKLRFGLATLCVGGGMGIATIVERL
jgi:acetyl-CoA C-acetyltransferase